MLTERGISVASSVFYTGCNICKFTPFVWDPINYRLLPPPKSHRIIYNVHRMAAALVFIFGVYRLLVSWKWQNIPDRQRVIHIIWTFAHAYLLTCFIQFHKSSSDMMHFVNSTWTYILKERGKTVKTDYVSGCVIFGGIMFYINTPAHGTGLFEILCTPIFVSSLVFPCRYPAEDVEGIFTKTPFLLFEGYIAAMVLFVIAFYWIIIFIGLAWLRQELRKARLTKDACHGNQKAPVCERMEKIVIHYRTCQHIKNLLNESFSIHLAWFPSLLMVIISLMLFATLKLWDIPLHAYLLFPACSLRCAFEMMTPLGMAGKVNEESSHVLAEWGKWLHVERRKPIKYAWLKAFHRSCPVIVCTAGSLYTFENSIVLCALHNCTQLTVNLLLMANRRKTTSISDTLLSSG